MSQEYLVTHRSNFDRSQLKSITDRNEVLNFVKVQNETLKQAIKDKLTLISGLDPLHTIVDDTITISPTIIISCNDVMFNVLKSDKNLSVQLNSRSRGSAGPDGPGNRGKGKDKDKKNK